METVRDDTPLTHAQIQAGVAHDAQMLLGPSNKLDLGCNAPRPRRSALRD
jgi:hypothetical protein